MALNFQNQRVINVRVNDGDVSRADGLVNKRYVDNLVDSENLSNLRLEYNSTTRVLTIQRSNGDIIDTVVVDDSDYRVRLDTILANDSDRIEALDVRLDELEESGSTDSDTVIDIVSTYVVGSDEISVAHRDFTAYEVNVSSTNGQRELYLDFQTNEQASHFVDNIDLTDNSNINGLAVSATPFTGAAVLESGSLLVEFPDGAFNFNALNNAGNPITAFVDNDNDSRVVVTLPESSRTWPTYSAMANASRNTIGLFAHIGSDDRWPGGGIGGANAVTIPDTPARLTITNTYDDSDLFVLYNGLRDRANTDSDRLDVVEARLNADSDRLTTILDGVDSDIRAAISDRMDEDSDLNILITEVVEDRLDLDSDRLTVVESRLDLDSDRLTAVELDLSNTDSDYNVRITRMEIQSQVDSDRLTAVELSLSNDDSDLEVRIENLETRVAADSDRLTDIDVRLTTRLDADSDRLTDIDVRLAAIVDADSDRLTDISVSINARIDADSDRLTTVYDELLRADSDIRNEFNPPVIEDTYSATFTYVSGRVSNIAYANDGEQYFKDFTYDENNRVTQITWNTGGTFDAGAIILTRAFVYNSDGRLININVT